MIKITYFDNTIEEFPEATQALSSETGEVGFTVLFAPPLGPLNDLPGQGQMDIGFNRPGSVRRIARLSNAVIKRIDYDPNDANLPRVVRDYNLF